jgi:hypothetical protein
MSSAAGYSISQFARSAIVAIVQHGETEVHRCAPFPIQGSERETIDANGVQSVFKINETADSLLRFKERVKMDHLDEDARAEIGRATSVLLFDGLYALLRLPPEDKKIVLVWIDPEPSCPKAVPLMKETPPTGDEESKSVACGGGEGGGPSSSSTLSKKEDGEWEFLGEDRSTMCFITSSKKGDGFFNVTFRRMGKESFRAMVTIDSMEGWMPHLRPSFTDHHGFEYVQTQKSCHSGISSVRVNYDVLPPGDLFTIESIPAVSAGEIRKNVNINLLDCGICKIVVNVEKLTMCVSVADKMRFAALLARRDAVDCFISKELRERAHEGDLSLVTDKWKRGTSWGNFVEECLVARGFQVTWGADLTKMTVSWCKETDVSRHWKTQPVATLKIRY